MINNVSVIIPIYNEVKNLAETVNKIHQSLLASTLTYELILVDDGSHDGSSAVIENLSLSNVKNIKHNINRGYGATLKSGVKSASFDTILIIDADGTYHSEDMLKLVHSMDDFDMLIGSRTGDAVAIPIIRKPVKAILKKMAEYLSGSIIPDLNSGLRIMKKSLVNRFMNILPDGFSFTSTTTLAALMNAYNVGFMPVNYNKRHGKSKIRPFRDTLNFFKIIISTFAPTLLSVTI